MYALVNFYTFNSWKKSSLKLKDAETMHIKLI